MRVLHVIPSVSACRGGPSTAIAPMVRALRAIDVDAAILATNDDGPDLLDVETGKWTEHAGERAYFLPRFSPPIRAVREFAIAPGFSAWARSNFPGFDIIHVHALFSFLPSRAMMVCRRLGLPYVLRPLGLLEPWSLAKSRIRKRAFLKLFDGRNLRAASAIHFTSVREREVSECTNGANGFIAALGVKTPEPFDGSDRNRLRAELAVDRETCVILFLARWHPKKGVPVLLRALERIRDRDWFLILAGSGDPDQERSIQLEIDRLGLRNRVRLPGFLQGREKEKAFATADLFVLPSRSENFGIAVAEAMVRGLPCIVTTDVAIASDISSADAGWVIDDAESQLSNALEIAITSRGERERRGGNAGDFARANYNWSRCAEILKREYTSILRDRSTE